MNKLLRQLLTALVACSSASVRRRGRSRSGYYTARLTALVAGLTMCSYSMAADGDLDTTFGCGNVTTAIGSSNDYGMSVAIQSDGKIVAAGYSWNGADYDFALARYNTNGILDTSFDTDGIVTTAIGTSNDYGNSVAIQSDGKIVVAGYSHNGSDYDFALARYNTNGILDDSFAGDGRVTTAIGSGDDYGRSMAIQTNGKIVVAGYSWQGGASNDFAVVRYNSNGSLDTSFDTDGKVTTDIGSGNDYGYSVAIQTNGEIVVAGYSCLSGTSNDFALVRYNSNGSLDTSFDTDGKVTTDISGYNDYGYSVAIQTNGEIVVAGRAGRTASYYDFGLVRYNSNGSLDTSFDTDGKVTTAFVGNYSLCRSVAIQTDGKIVAAGYCYMGAYNNDFALARYNSNGSLDTNFADDGKVTTIIGSGNDICQSVAIQSDSKIVAVCYSYNGSDYDFALVRYNIDGSLALFSTRDGKVTTDIAGYGEYIDYGYSVAIQTDGKIVVAGRAGRTASYYDFGLARYNIDGSLDMSFDSDGKVTTAIGGNYARAYSVAIQTDGKIVASGNSYVSGQYDIAVARYESDGSLDDSFDSDGKLTTAIGSSTESGNGVAIQSDGKIVAAGYSHNGSDYDFALVRYNSNGSLDTSFDDDGKVTTAIGSGNDVGYSVAIQSDGKILAAGYSYNGADNDFALVRYNSNGSLDTSFDNDGKVTTAIGSSNDYAYSMAIQSDGKIVTAGYSHNGTDNDFAVVRYNTDGSLDTGFAGDGKVTTAIGSGDDMGYSVAIQWDRKIVVAGYSHNGSDYDFAVVRYKRDGSLDARFAGDGKVTTAIGLGDAYGQSVAIQSDWKIVVAGYSLMSTNDFAVVRYENSPIKGTVFYSW